MKQNIRIIRANVSLRLASLGVDEVLERLLVAVADGDVHVSKDDAVSLYLTDFALLNDK